jgi:ribosome-binding factor A
MKIDRLTRVNELLRREIASALYRLLDRSTFDMAAVTITHVITSSDLRTARVLVSIRGHEADRRRMLNRLQGLHGALQQEVSGHVILKYTPKLHFVLDESVESGDRVLNLLSTLATKPGEAPGDHES